MPPDFTGCFWRVLALNRQGQERERWWGNGGVPIHLVVALILICEVDENGIKVHRSLAPKRGREHHHLGGVHGAEADRFIDDLLHGTLRKCGPKASVPSHIAVVSERHKPRHPLTITRIRSVRYPCSVQALHAVRAGSNHANGEGPVALNRDGR